MNAEIEKAAREALASVFVDDDMPTTADYIRQGRPVRFGDASIPLRALAKVIEAQEALPDYKSGWESLSEPLSWMQHSKQLGAYLGWNLADVANDLIDRAYPGLRPKAPKL